MAEKAMLVVALFDYDRKHNDELSFKKGDIITITQAIEGGWWEGTLCDVTAWLPSNYVTKIEETTDVSPYDDLPCEDGKNIDDKLTFQNEITRNIVDGEIHLINELNNLLYSFVHCLEQVSNLPFLPKVHRLRDFLHQIIPLHRSLSNSLEEMLKSPEPRRVGKLFLNFAPSLATAYFEYSSFHLYIVSGLDKYKNSIQSQFEQNSHMFNLAKFKQQLSLPFDRLCKYPQLLKELEKYYEDSHVDRGDLQRSAVVFDEINDDSMNIRKLKERDLDILCASILGWKGERLSQLGDPVYTERVCNSANLEVFDHVIVVFQPCILLLACTDQADVYAFKSKISIDGLSVTLKESNSFELCSGLTGECLTLSCSDMETRQRLLETIYQVAERAPQPAPFSHNNICEPSPAVRHTPSQVMKAANHSLNVQTNYPGAGGVSPGVHAHLHHSPNSLHSNNSSNHSPPVNPQPPPASLSSNSQQPLPAPVMRAPKRIPLTNLRPDPPVLSAKEELARRPRSPGPRGQSGHRITRKKSDRQKSAINADELDKSLGRIQDAARRVEDDTLILQVIEAYCAANQSKHTSKSLDLAKLRLSDAEIRRGGRPMVIPQQLSSQSHQMGLKEVHAENQLAGFTSPPSESNNLPPPPPPPPKPGTVQNNHLQQTNQSIHASQSNGSNMGIQPHPPNYHQMPYQQTHPHIYSDHPQSMSRQFVPLHQLPNSGTPLVTQHHHPQRGQSGSVTSTVVPPPVVLPTRAGRKL